MGKGLRSDSKRTGSEGGKTGRHRRMQTSPFIVPGSDCVVKEIMNFMLKASFICVILRPF